MVLVVMVGAPSSINGVCVSDIESDFEGQDLSEKYVLVCSYQNLRDGPETQESWLF